MLRRNKVTALVTAVATIVSMTPVKANAASEYEVKSQKGQIYSAIAYKDGKMYIAGEPNEKDEAAYYLSNSKYSELEDINYDDKTSLYGEKYVNINDGEYFVDLSNGKVSEDKIIDNTEDEVSINLRKNIRNSNDGRYNNDDVNEVKELTQLPNFKFNDGWYSVEYKTKEVQDDINGGAEKFTVYTDQAGKYIDADYNLGKIKVKLSNGKTADIENTNDEDERVRASVKADKVIAQDSNNIYRLAKITIKSDIAIKSVNGLEITDSTDSISKNKEGTEVEFDVLQVISKSQSSGKVDGIKYAKTVTSYMLSDKEGKKVSLLNDNEDAFTVADGKLINYEVSGNYIEAEVINLKTKSSLNYIDRGNSGRVKLQGSDYAVDIDVDGNIWALTDGYIRKFDNDESFEKLYSINKEYDNISVYDKDNIIVWNSGDDIYAIVGQVKKDDPIVEKPVVEKPVVEKPTVKQGWEENTADKTWTYNNADGSKYKGWLSVNGTWYYMDTQTGIMKTGWVSDAGAWYYLNSDGSMKTGWLKDTSGKWYYMQGSGAMKTGWLLDGGKWYYLNSDGSMALNTTIGSYRLGSDGAWIQ